MGQKGMTTIALAMTLAAGFLFQSEAHAVSVCIDPGHGGSDGGASGCGLVEAERTLYSAKLLKPMLEAVGYTVYMTRTTDTDVSLSARSSYANSKGVTTFVSIHNNAYNGAAHGIETFCYTNNLGARSGTQAKNIQSEMLKVWDLTNRGAKEANYHVVRETSMPATLSELAFIDYCATDAKYLGDATRQKQAMQAHCKALVAQWGGSASKCTASTGGGTTTPVTPSTGKVMAGTFHDSVSQANWLGGVKYTIGSQSQTSGSTYQIMTFTVNVGKYTATASKDGYETKSRSDCDAVTAGGTSWCSIALTKKATVIVQGTASGAVKNAITGANVAGATVSVKNGASTTYNGSTNWSFKLNPGSYQISGKAKGYEDKEISCKVESNKTTDCTLTLTPLKGTITGIVTDGTQNVAASVELSGQKVAYDGNGKYKFTVEAGTYTVTAIADGYDVGTSTCTVGAGESVDCNITVVKKVVERGTLKGSVTDADTGDMIMSTVQTNGETTQFLGKDNYRFYLTPGTYEVTATADGYNEGKQSCEVTANNVTTCNIELTAKNGGFAGVVIDAVSQEPVADVALTLNGTAIEVASDGTWRYDDAKPGDYQITATAKGYRSATVTCHIEPGNASSPCDIQLVADDAATGSLQGYVYDSRSESMLIAASVSVEGFGSSEYPGKGKWQLSDLPAGMYSVTVKSDGYYTVTVSCEVMAGDDENSFSNCNVGLVSIDDGGGVIEAEYDEPLVTLESYSESCSGLPRRGTTHSQGLILIAAGLIAGLAIRRRHTKGDVR